MKKNETIEVKELNKIYHCNCMDGLRSLPDNSIDLIITSPPYNLKGHIKYDVYVDDRDEMEYQAEQVEFINLCLAKLKDTGSIFYNHKNRMRGGVTISPLEWIFKSDAVFRQEIIWNRRGSQRCETMYYLQNTEKIYWLTKSRTNVRFQRQSPVSEVWEITAKKSAHPAPFPVELCDNIIPHILGDKKMRAELGGLVVMDPYMGSGTVAVAAKKWGCDYIGFDLSKDYIKMAEERIAHTEQKVSNNAIDLMFDVK